MSTERILVHTSIASEFKAKLKAIVEKDQKEGSAPVVINQASVQKSKNLIRKAVANGATLLAGDIDAKESIKTRLGPIIVDNVTPIWISIIRKLSGRQSP